MKTLSDELAQRLSRIRGEREHLASRLKKLSELEQAISLLMQEEELLARGRQLPLSPIKVINGEKGIGHTDLSRFMLKVLADGKPRSLTEIEAMAKVENINFNNKKPKRVLHFVLIALKRNGYARMVDKENSVWQLTEKAINRDLANNRRDLQVKQETTTVAGQ